MPKLLRSLLDRAQVLPFTARRGYHQRLVGAYSRAGFSNLGLSRMH